MAEVERRDYVFWFNLGLATIHIASSIAIGVYGYANLRDKAITNFYAFTHVWYNLDGIGTCGKADFMIDTSADAKVINKDNSFWVDSLVLCILFGVISATYHIIICIGSQKRSWTAGFDSLDYIESISNPLRWLDYGMSTPLMHIVLFANYGVVSQWAVICGALGMGLLQFVGYSIELLLEVCVFTDTWPTSVYIIPLFGFIGLFILFVPLFWNITYLRNFSDLAEEPPAAVQAFTVVIFLLYTVFGFVSIRQIVNVRKPEQRQALQAKAATLTEAQAKYFYGADLLYGSASACAKTVLHWGLAFVVLNQDNMVTDTPADNPTLYCSGTSSPDNNAIGPLIGIIFASIALFLLITCCVRLPVINKTYLQIARNIKKN